MTTPLSITAAVYAADNSSLVRLTFNDQTRFAIYLNNGSPPTYAHDLLDDWLAAGNVIAEP